MIIDKFNVISTKRRGSPSFFMFFIYKKQMFKTVFIWRNVDEI
ncbi:hypothetical protein PMCN06_0723 [Pasteurella multocida subsp. multocida str. HN06]|nr:hypothetical protein PMCN06_0723 [Pasteurella multocida subsp. multocida str. HN06]